MKNPQINSVHFKKSYVKLCEMQHSLLKKYENEVNSNAVKQDLINHMKLEIDELTDKCKNSDAERSELLSRISQLDELEMSFKSMLLDYETCKIKCKKYKSELKCFDEKFFDELEDMKFNYHKAIKMNKHYENLLMKMNKTDLVVVKEGKKPKNKVKFDKSSKEHDIDDYQNECGKSFETELCESSSECHINSSSENSSFNYEDYLDDNEINQTLEYNDLIEQLS